MIKLSPCSFPTVAGSYLATGISFYTLAVAGTFCSSSSGCGGEIISTLLGGSIISSSFMGGWISKWDRTSRLWKC